VWAVLPQCEFLFGRERLHGAANELLAAFSCDARASRRIVTIAFSGNRSVSPDTAADIIIISVVVVIIIVGVVVVVVVIVIVVPRTASRELGELCSHRRDGCFIAATSASSADIRFTVAVHVSLSNNYEKKCGQYVKGVCILQVGGGLSKEYDCFSFSFSVLLFKRKYDDINHKDDEYC
jgi:hypothetical protein